MTESNYKKKKQHMLTSWSPKRHSALGRLNPSAAVLVDTRFECTMMDYYLFHWARFSLFLITIKKTSGVQWNVLLD